MNEQQYRMALSNLFGEAPAAPVNELYQILSRARKHSRRLVLVPAISCAFSFVFALSTVLSIPVPQAQTGSQAKSTASDFTSLLSTNEYESSFDPYQNLVTYVRGEGEKKR